MAILNRLKANPWVVTLLSLAFMLMLVLIWNTAAYAHSDTPFDAQYTLFGIEDDHVERGQDLGQSSGTSTGAGQEARMAIQGLLPSTGGPLLLLVILGGSAFCFSSALLMQYVRHRRR